MNKLSSLWQLLKTGSINGLYEELAQFAILYQEIITIIVAYIIILAIITLFAFKKQWVSNFIIVAVSGLIVGFFFIISFGGLFGLEWIGFGWVVNYLNHLKSLVGLAV